jgi:hypothetical protein
MRLMTFAGALSWRLDLLTGLLLPQELFQRIFVVILELLRIEMRAPSYPSKFFILNVIEIFVLFADFVRISQRHTEEPLAAVRVR